MYSIDSTVNATFAQRAAIRDLALDEENYPVSRDDYSGALTFVVITDDTDVITYSIDIHGAVIRETLNGIGDGWTTEKLDQATMTWHELEEDEE